MGGVTGGAKTCFVIAPIGEDGSETRRRSDRVFTHLIEPAANECGYRAIRADKISQPGIITVQVIHQVLKAPMAVADLTGHNANAFYELAIRHMVKKPLVQMIKKGEKIPFDVAASRVLYIEDPDLDTIEKAKTELIEHIRSAERGSESADNPISVSVDLEALRQSNDPMRAQLAELAATVTSALAAIRADVADLKKADAQAARLFPISTSSGIYDTAEGPGWLNRFFHGGEVPGVRSQDKGETPKGTD